MSDQINDWEFVGPPKSFDETVNILKHYDMELFEPTLNGNVWVADKETLKAFNRAFRFYYNQKTEEMSLISDKEDPRRSIEQSGEYATFPGLKSTIEDLTDQEIKDFRNKVREAASWKIKTIAYKDGEEQKDSLEPVAVSDMVCKLEVENWDMKEDIEFLKGVIAVNFCKFEGSKAPEDRIIWEDFEEFKKIDLRTAFIKVLKFYIDKSKED